MQVRLLVLPGTWQCSRWGTAAAGERRPLCQWRSCCKVLRDCHARRASDAPATRSCVTAMHAVSATLLLQGHTWPLRLPCQRHCCRKVMCDHHAHCASDAPATRSCVISAHNSSQMTDRHTAKLIITQLFISSRLRNMNFIPVWMIWATQE